MLPGLALDRFSGKVLSLCISIPICRVLVIKVSFRRVEPNRNRPNGGSCASIGLAAIANKQRYLTARHCPKHKATPQLRLVEFFSSTNGPRSAPDPTVASGRNNLFPVTGAGE